MILCFSGETVVDTQDGAVEQGLGAGVCLVVVTAKQGERCMREQPQSISSVKQRQLLTLQSLAADA